MSPTSYHCSTPRRGESGGGSGNDLLSQRQAASIVGAGALHDRVREGNGWAHPAPVTAPAARPPRDRRQVPCLHRRISDSSWNNRRAGGWDVPREQTRRPRSLVPLRYSACTPSTGGLSTSSSRWDLTGFRPGRPHLGASFALRCFQRLSRPDGGYRAMPLAGQLVHRRSGRPGPLVLGAAPRKSPAPTTDRDRTVSRRSEPSSRTALMGEQPNPWEGLPPQDATSRHRGAKPCRRCGLSGKISLLSPG